MSIFVISMMLCQWPEGFGNYQPLWMHVYCSRPKMAPAEQWVQGCQGNEAESRQQMLPVLGTQMHACGSTVSHRSQETERDRERKERRDNIQWQVSTPRYYSPAPEAHWIPIIELDTVIRVRKSHSVKKKKSPTKCILYDATWNGQEINRTLWYIWDYFRDHF